MALFVVSCTGGPTKNKQVVVTNLLDIDRKHETLSVPLAKLGLDSGKTVIIKYADTKKELVTQTVDSDGDGNFDVILFQPEIEAGSEVVFDIFTSDTPSSADSIIRCYSRFVPERTDDYAWENDRVAFRTYGPKAQKMVEDKVKGGTLTSGIDAWLKRVDYPIINKWYKEELSGEISYHKDTGEGLDNFHVGASRGVGGIAMKVDSTYYFSKNFTTWKTLYNGPIRTSFILTYADWDAAGNLITEEKHISLDYGSNLSRFEVGLKGTDMISAGLTLHEKDGVVGFNQEEGWVSYWEPHEDSELGTAIVVPNKKMMGHEYYETARTDESNLFAHLAVDEGKVVYYAGFGWKKSGQFETKTAWENYVSLFSKKVNSPMLVEFR